MVIEAQLLLATAKVEGSMAGQHALMKHQVMVWELYICMVSCVQQGIWKALTVMLPQQVEPRVFQPQKNQGVYLQNGVIALTRSNCILQKQGLGMNVALGASLIA
jgi:hypothetical protein